MARLTEEERKARDAKRAEEQKAHNRARWTESLAKAKPLVADAGAQLAEAIQTKALNMRDIWLVVAVFEIEEKMAKVGQRESCKTKWFDRVAPRAKPDVYPYHGLSGYATKTATKAAQFLKLSHNGYVYLTDLGYAAVQWLRENFPAVHPESGMPDYKKAIPLPSLGDDVALPYPRWRQYKDWDQER